VLGERKEARILPSKEAEALIFGWMVSYPKMEIIRCRKTEALSGIKTRNVTKREKQENGWIKNTVSVDGLKFGMLQIISD